MKYVVLIIDGAAGHPIPQQGGKTTLELARTSHLDSLAQEGQVGLTHNVPEGMEPSSALACMSIMGYDPRTYYRGRSAIEALSMGIDIRAGEVVFRCNLVALRDGKMLDYSSGHITTEESRDLILAIDKNLGNDHIKFFPGVSYRHILKLKGYEETVEAVCTPPHDITGKPVASYLPQGKGSKILNDLMRRSQSILSMHFINQDRIAHGETPATTIWLFWPSGQVPALPQFQKTFGLKAAMISGVDLLRGLAQMAKMDVIKVDGVTDGLDNDYAAQGEGALKAMKDHDLVMVHVEAPDEAGHSGSIGHKVEAIEKVDQEIVSRLQAYIGDDLRLLILPDHPTPIDLLTHTSGPVPFLLWGSGFHSNGACRLTEMEAGSTNFIIENGYDIINKLIKVSK